MNQRISISRPSPCLFVLFFFSPFSPLERDRKYRSGKLNYSKMGKPPRSEFFFGYLFVSNKIDDYWPLSLVSLFVD